jgi:hypothetical protein
LHNQCRCKMNIVKVYSATHYPCNVCHVNVQTFIFQLACNNSINFNQLCPTFIFFHLVSHLYVYPTFGFFNSKIPRVTHLLKSTTIILFYFNNMCLEFLHEI